MLRGAAVNVDAREAAVLSPEEVLARVASTPQGLTSAEAARRLAVGGLNALRTRRVSPLAILASQLRNPLLILLLAAATVSGLTGDPTDAAIIAAIVVLSVGLGFINEYRAANAVAALRSAISHTSVVWRDGRQTELATTQLVPGDVVTLRVGDVVPADLRLVEANGLECDEAILTGESLPAAKSPLAQPGASALELPSCALMGTVVHQGGGRGVVIATGTATAFGMISVGLSERPAETAFQLGLRGFSRMLARIAAVLTISIFVMNVALSRPLLEALLFSLAIAIGITPQLLPAIVAVSLATGSRALARRKVLVKRLVTIEDFGNVEVLFTDKTGTLTEGAVTFRQSLDPAGRPADAVLQLGLLCNEAVMGEHGPVGGNALDVALLAAPTAAGAMAGAGPRAPHERLGTLPFDHERRRTSVIVAADDGARTLIVKGAPEAILALCVDVPDGAGGVLDRLLADGARVVAVATRTAPDRSTPSPDDERDLTLAGFLAFEDRPKADAGAAIAKLATLGVAVKVVTGDHPAVAAKVCHDIGLPVAGTLTGDDMAVFDDDTLIDAIATTTIFGRVSPDQKARLVKLARRGGADVAVLGDGVNDALALHAADVGISVDSAADVAKDAADIVLLEKDLGVLADGIMEGRRIFANTLKYVLMATSSNFGNMFSAAGASLFLSFLPMLPSQVLLNNLLYDVGQLAIPTDRVDPEVLTRPAAWDLAFVRRFMAVFGPLSSIFDFMTFGVMLIVLNAGHAEFRTGWFVESLATQTLVVFVIRTRRVPFLRSRPSRGMAVLPVVCAAIGVVLPFTPIAHALGFTPLPLTFFLILIAMIATYLLLVEVAKAQFYRVQAHPRRARPTPSERDTRHLQRRVSRFTHHVPRS